MTLIEHDRKEKSLQDFDRLSRLFAEDRFSFEQERKRLIEDTINECKSAALRSLLWDLQYKLDTVLKHSCSEQNRFVLMKMFFWDHIHNVLIPSLSGYDRALRKAFPHRQNRSKPHLSLLKK